MATSCPLHKRNPLGAVVYKPCNIVPAGIVIKESDILTSCHVTAPPVTVAE